MPNLPVVQEMFEQVQHLPSIETPVALVGSLATASAAALMTWRRHGQSSEAFAVHSTNPELLEQTIIAVDGKVADARMIGRPNRLAGGLMALAGLGMLVGSQTGHLTYETSSADSGANTIVLLDTSSSMDTKDLGSTNDSRLQASVKGLQATNFNGNVGLVEFASTIKTRLPLAKHENLGINNQTARTVNSNGGQLAEALQLSIDQLPGHVGKDNKTIRDGSVVVITDGTVDSSKQDIKNVVDNNNVDLKVIVTGTPGGTYKKAGQNVDSAIQPELFGAIKAGNVTVANNESKIESAIQETIHNTTTNKTERDWQIADGVGVILLAAGIARVNWQMAIKKV